MHRRLAVVRKYWSKTIAQIGHRMTFPGASLSGSEYAAAKIGMQQLFRKKSCPAAEPPEPVRLLKLGNAELARSAISRYGFLSSFPN